MYGKYEFRIVCASCGGDIGLNEDYYFVDGLSYCEGCMDGMKITGYIPDEWDWSGEDERFEDEAV